MERRHFLRSLAVAGIAVSVPGVFAQELVRTPRQTEGPFYPDKLPLDTDNDLLIINDRITPAVGEITYLSGRILDASGEPVRNALVEIWQVDRNGAYLHSRQRQQRPARQELPGLRPVHHRIDRRVLLPHDQAGALPRAHARTSTSRSSSGDRNRSRRSATSRASRSTRETACSTPFAIRRRARRCSSRSCRSRSRGSESWPRSSTSCLA